VPFGTITPLIISVRLYIKKTVTISLTLTVTLLGLGMVFRGINRCQAAQASSEIWYTRDIKSKNTEGGGCFYKKYFFIKNI
jgi:hypothetical protein